MALPNYLAAALQNEEHFAKFVYAVFNKVSTTTKRKWNNLFNAVNVPLKGKTFKADIIVLALSDKKTDEKKKALATKMLLALILDEQANSASSYKSAKLAAKTALQKIIDDAGLQLLNEQRFVVDAPAAVQGKAKPLPLGKGKADADAEASTQEVADSEDEAVADSEDEGESPAKTSDHTKLQQQLASMRKQLAAEKQGKKAAEDAAAVAQEGMQQAQDLLANHQLHKQRQDHRSAKKPEAKGKDKKTPKQKLLVYIRTTLSDMSDDELLELVPSSPIDVLPLGKSDGIDWPKWVAENEEVVTELLTAVQQEEMTDRYNTILSSSDDEAVEDDEAEDEPWTCTGLDGTGCPIILEQLQAATQAADAAVEAQALAASNNTRKNRLAAEGAQTVANAFPFPNALEATTDAECPLCGMARKILRHTAKGRYMRVRSGIDRRTRPKLGQMKDLGSASVVGGCLRQDSDGKPIPCGQHDCPYCIRAPSSDEAEEAEGKGNPGDEEDGDDSATESESGEEEGKRKRKAAGAEGKRQASESPVRVPKSKRERKPKKASASGSALGKRDASAGASGSGSKPQGSKPQGSKPQGSKPQASQPTAAASASKPAADGGGSILGKRKSQEELPLYLMLSGVPEDSGLEGLNGRYDLNSSTAYERPIYEHAQKDAVLATAMRGSSTKCLRWMVQREDQLLKSDEGFLLLHEDATRVLPHEARSNWQYYGPYGALGAEARSSAGWNNCEDIKFSPPTGGQGGSAPSAP